MVNMDDHKAGEPRAEEGPEGSAEGRGSPIGGISSKQVAAATGVAAVAVGAAVVAGEELLGDAGPQAAAELLGPPAETLGANVPSLQPLEDLLPDAPEPARKPHRSSTSADSDSADSTAGDREEASFQQYGTRVVAAAGSGLGAAQAATTAPSTPPTAGPTSGPRPNRSSPPEPTRSPARDASPEADRSEVLGTPEVSGPDEPAAADPQAKVGTTESPDPAQPEPPTPGRTRARAPRASRPPPPPPPRPR